MSINQILSILWRRLWLVLIGLVATVVGAAVVLAVVPPRYEAKATASIDTARADPVTGDSSASSARGLMGGLMALIESQRIATDVVRRLNLTSDPQLTQQYLASGASGQLGINEWIAQSINKNVDAKSMDGTNVIEIHYRSPSPIQAALVANTYLASFEDAVLDLKVSAAQQTAAWLEPQLEKMRADLEASRDKLTKFQRDTQLLAPGAGGDTDISPLLSTGTDLSSAKAQLLTLQSQLAAIDSGQGASTSLLDSPVLTSLKSSMASVASDLGRLRTELGANNPKVQALLATQKSLQEQMSVELGTIRRTASMRMKALQDQINTLQGNYSDQYGKMINVQAQRDQLASLQREVAFRQEQLDVASKNAASAKMQGQLSFSNITTLDNATPPTSPTFPKIPLVAGLALGAGLGLGVIFALIAEALDRRIRVVNDLNYSTDVPLLGVIAKVRRKAIRRSKDKGFSLSLPSAQR
ncbi:GumC family protein [Lichenifustis flavocetrariae]|uniref:Wzz/FepE/Etk N-terminal domain-containing protein n=1 Tax=Lichenifustis flavocetrariae TaxID=2949735 RepID=A0AA41Z2B3_9HYPH|nr:Wzz/FepE/Etk N-terminal domain-containing protein [Lichenifustis flavocetrariae]MCW6509055.1 Wzz/FepE/Etk N-terminal domain-containing protein [Lichenifustis flavocetrariae]